MAELDSPARPASYDKKIGLVLQGGGALGSYQAGVYETLATSEYPPDWVAGISIGAINAAIIAGNAPQQRVARLRDFWEGITAPTTFWQAAPAGPLADWQQRASALAALLFGQPGFFVPRGPQDWFSPGKLVSYYETSALKATLERLVDFDRINDLREMRISVGAVNVRTGAFSYFDSEKIRIRPEHVMASGALPPPSNLDEVAEREKDLRYSSRTKIGTDAFRDKHNVRHAINELHKLLPPELADTEQAKRLYHYGCVTEMDIVQLIYRPREPQGSAKDFEFSRSTMNARWQQGMADARTTLQASPWLAPMPQELGVRVFDVVHDILVARRAPAAGAKPAGTDPPKS